MTHDELVKAAAEISRLEKTLAHLDEALDNGYPVQRVAVAFEIPGHAEKNKYVQLRGQEDDCPGFDAAVNEMLLRLRDIYQGRLTELNEWMRRRFQ